jgi:hypothetical protein
MRRVSRTKERLCSEERGRASGIKKEVTRQLKSMERQKGDTDPTPAPQG